MEKNLTLTIGKPDEVKGYMVVKFSGELDKAGHVDIRDVLDDVVDKFVLKTLVFDFTGLKFINSEGIGYIMEINNHLAGKKQKLVVVGLASNVADVFKAIGLKDVVEIHKSLDSFLSS